MSCSNSQFLSVSKNYDGFLTSCTIVTRFSSCNNYYHFTFWQFQPNSIAFCILNSVVFCFVVFFTSCFDSSGRLDYSVLLFCWWCDGSGRILLFCCNFHLMFWQLRLNSTVLLYFSPYFLTAPDEFDCSTIQYCSEFERSVVLLTLYFDSSSLIRLFCCIFHFTFWQFRPNWSVLLYL